MYIQYLVIGNNGKEWGAGRNVYIHLKSESVSHSIVSDSVTLWTVAHQAPLSMKFSRQESWSGLPFPPPGDLPNPGVKPVSLMFPALAGVFFNH